MPETPFEESDFGKAVAAVSADLSNLKSVIAARQNRPIRSSRSLRKGRPLKLSDFSKQKSPDDIVIVLNPSIGLTRPVPMTRKEAERTGSIIIG